MAPSDDETFGFGSFKDSHNLEQEKGIQKPIVLWLRAFYEACVENGMPKELAEQMTRDRNRSMVYHVILRPIVESRKPSSSDEAS